MSRLGQRFVSRSRISAIRPSSASSRTNSAPRELGDDARGQVILGRAEAAARAHEVHPGRGEEAQRVEQVLGRSPTTIVWAWSTPRPAQLLGQPRPVAVEHAAGEHLGARDDDARARALTARGRRAAGRSRRRPAVIS
jgi:hypothetical protein